jgi:hypothetical protein
MIVTRIVTLGFLLLTLCTTAVCMAAEEEDALIFTSATVENFDRMLKSAREKSLVIVQVSPELFDHKKARILMNWVSRGGTLWFYDSRLAGFFSMKSSPFAPGTIKYKELEGEYGSEKKFPGIAIGCEAWGNHSLTIGIREVVVFALRVEGEGKGAKYSAVSEEAGVTPLLRLGQKDTECIAAIRDVGKGHVIFKPLLWEDQFDGRNFQRKLLKYSNGNPVPFFR